jgi:CopA family copper-resistance protein
MNRRRFMLGAAGALSGIPCLPRRALAAPSRAPVLSGTEFQLEIGPTPINITGQPRIATAVNGQVPGPILRWREGDTVTLAVTNRLSVPSSIHWHGIRVPSPMDGVPGLSFNGIAPGETFIYRFPVHQSGTYWYHSHSGFQEQTGVDGPIVIVPKGGYAQAFDRDYVVFLSDWSDENPDTIVSNLKFQSGYYNYGERTVGTFVDDAEKKGLGATVADRLEWGKMRMSPTDILDVSGATYTYLINGQPPGANWTALFRPGERVRLRFINGSVMSIYDVRIPDLRMTVVQADGNNVEPVTVDEFRISVAETYDVIVQPPAERAYTIFVQPEDRSGYARGTLAPRPGMAASIPPMDPRPLRTMADMGMGSMDHGSIPGMGIWAPCPGWTTARCQVCPACKRAQRRKNFRAASRSTTSPRCRPSA